MVTFVEITRDGKPYILNINNIVYIRQTTVYQGYDNKDRPLYYVGLITDNEIQLEVKEFEQLKTKLHII